MALNHFVAEIPFAHLLIGWTFPIWAYGTTVALLAVFGGVTYFFLKARRSRKG